jgi:hypothetical protein
MNLFGEQGEYGSSYSKIQGYERGMKDSETIAASFCCVRRGGASIALRLSSTLQTLLHKVEPAAPVVAKLEQSLHSVELVRFALQQNERPFRERSGRSAAWPNLVRLREQRNRSGRRLTHRFSRQLLLPASSLRARQDDSISD